MNRGHQLQDVCLKIWHTSRVSYYEQDLDIEPSQIQPLRAVEAIFQNGRQRLLI